MKNYLRILALLGCLLTTSVACVDQDDTETVTTEPTTTTGVDVTYRVCHLSAEEVANWPETSARLPQACAE